MPLIPLSKRFESAILRLFIDLEKKNRRDVFLILQFGVKRGTMKHLEEVGMGYFQHMFGAFKLAFRFITGAIMLVIHAFLPNIFVNAGKNTVEYYNSP